MELFHGQSFRPHDSAIKESVKFDSVAVVFRTVNDMMDPVIPAYGENKLK